MGVGKLFYFSVFFKRGRNNTGVFLGGEGAGTIDQNTAGSQQGEKRVDKQ